MYATERYYSGLDQAALDELRRRRAEIQTFVNTLPGLMSWYAFTDANSLTTITISENRAAAEEIIREVANWIRQNMPTFLPNPPEVRMGDVIASVSKATAPSL